MAQNSKQAAQGGAQGQYLHQQQRSVQTQPKEQNQKAPEKKDFSFSFSHGDQLDNELRKPRSRAYMEIFDAIDMLSATDEEIIEKLKENMDEDTAEEFASMSVEELLEEIRASIQEEFQSTTIEIKSVLHGVLAKCYIDGCDCHAISAEGDIIDHYNKSESLPENLQKGRAVFRKYPNCRCVEVYSDCCRVISYDSTVTKIPNNQI